MGDLGRYVTSTTFMAMISVLVVVVVVWVAISLLLKWRERNNDEPESPESYLKDFEEMRLGGDLTEAEYRNIRALLDSKKNGNSSIAEFSADEGPSVDNHQR